jgi:hypothetical protein
MSLPPACKSLFKSFLLFLGKAPRVSSNRTLEVAASLECFEADYSTFSAATFILDSLQARKEYLELSRPPVWPWGEVYLHVRSHGV